MRDKNNTHASSKQLPQANKQTFGFGGSKRGGRFIEDQNSRIAHQPAEDFHHLAIGDIQRSCQTMQIKLAAQRRQHHGRGGAQGVLQKQDIVFLPDQTGCFLLSTGLEKAAVPGERDKCPADEHELALI